MASLYKKPVMIVDRSTGEKVKKTSKKWWGQYKDAHERLKRVPLSVDKTAAQAMLNQIVQSVEREKAGLVDPSEKERKRPLAEHLKEFQSYLTNKGVTTKQMQETMAKLRRMIKNRGWRLIGHIVLNQLEMEILIRLG